jgi:pilus assembly protein Flp/PilA
LNDLPRCELERRSSHHNGIFFEVPYNLFHRFIEDQSGVTAIEYGLIAALIAVIIIVGVTAVGTSLSGTFQSIATALA